MDEMPPRGCPAFRVFIDKKGRLRHATGPSVFRSDFLLPGGVPSDGSRLNASKNREKINFLNMPDDPAGFMGSAPSLWGKEAFGSQN